MIGKGHKEEVGDGVEAALEKHLPQEEADIVIKGRGKILLHIWQRSVHIVTWTDIYMRTVGKGKQNYGRC